MSDWSRELLEYRCDWCSRPKKRGELWIVGLAGECSGATGNRRLVETLKKWNAEWAVHPLAVHFCSEKHKDRYIDALFTCPWPSSSKRSVVARTMIRRRKAEPSCEKVSDAMVERHICEQSVPAAVRGDQANTKAKKPAKRKAKRAFPSPFTETDTLYARSLGVVLNATVQSKDPASEK